MNYKTIIVGAAATLIGGAAGFLVGKIVYEKKCDNEVADLRAYYNSRLKNKNSITPRINTSDDGIGRNPSAIVTEEGYTKYHRDNITTVPVSEAEESTDDLTDEEESELESEEIKEKVNKIIEGSKIEIISEDEIGDFTGFGMTYLTYYEKDGILADDNDDVMLDYEGIIGYNAIPELLTSKYDDCIYVANRSYMTIYEITVHPGKYADAIGIVDESDD